MPKTISSIFQVLDKLGSQIVLRFAHNTKQFESFDHLNFNFIGKTVQAKPVWAVHAGPVLNGARLNTHISEAEHKTENGQKIMKMQDYEQILEA